MCGLKSGTLIVTGASMGIGRALALGLAHEGVNLVLNARSREPLHETAQNCSGYHVMARTAAGDISRVETVKQCVEKGREMGGPTGFIHAAGILSPGAYLWEMQEESFNEVMDSNVKASFLLVRYAVPEIMNRQNGLAVFVGSGAAEITQPGIGAYCSAKAAEEHLARQLAAETDRITCFVFRPGIVDTRMQDQARQAQGGAAGHLHRVFRPWKERGELLTPEQSAASLIKLLKGDLSKLHGGIFRAGE